jgi:hypothetical protein
MDPTLLNWMRWSFTVDLVIGMYRVICDRDERSNSFYNFLEELKKDRNKIYRTRGRYVSLYTQGPNLDSSLLRHKLRLANGDFNRLAGNNRKLFPLYKIKPDMSRITEKRGIKEIKRIIRFRNQYLAHSDKKRRKVNLTYSQLFDVFNMFEEMFKKYYLLITASSIWDLRSTMQGNWKQVLTIPWISSSNKISTAL